VFTQPARVFLVIACAAAYLGSSARPAGAQVAGKGLTVHEWGTFTTVAGADGRAIDWLPLSGPTDLPCFVHHYRNDPRIKLGPETKPLDYDAARANLWGKVRMETPVLYFYATQETSVSVRVRFPQGLMTEWYPEASVAQGVVARAVLRDPTLASVIEWPNVTITPWAKNVFPVDVAESHYYAARTTDAAPLVVNGHAEKFLFYRGVADFAVPITAQMQPDGRIRIGNTGAHELPAAILFENRNGAIGYRLLGAIRTEIIAAPPSLDAEFVDLRRDLEQLLVGAGLYPKEAAAMVETWRDSWFEEGTRVFYLVPARTVDALLPLTISPAPAQVARVFVGRMDVVTPVTERAVELALASDDANLLDRHGRLLGPITDAVLARGTNSKQHDRIRELRNAALKRYTATSPVCR
jgi:hypothetical protein